MVCTKCIRFDSQTFYQTYCVRISLGISTFFPLWPTEWFCLENCTSRNLIKTIVFWIHKNVHFFLWMYWSKWRPHSGGTGGGGGGVIALLHRLCWGITPNRLFSFHFAMNNSRWIAHHWFTPKRAHKIPYDNW